MLPLILFTIMYEIHHRFLPKVDLDNMSHLLMNILIIVEFILFKIIIIFYYIYHIFHAMVKTQQNDVTKYFHCGLDCEYTSNKCFELYAYDVTIHHTSYSNIPQQNKVVERNHCHIIKTARSLLLSASVSIEF